MTPGVKSIGTVTVDDLREALREALEKKTDIGRATEDLLKTVPASKGDVAGVAILLRRYGLRRCCLKIVRTLDGDGPLPCLVLEPKQGYWLVEPYIVRRKTVEEDNSLGVKVVGRWVELLLSYVEDEYEATRAAFSTGQRDFDSLGLELRFNERIHQFLSHGPKAFFTTDARALRWFICAWWDKWNHAGLTYEDRHTRAKNAGYNTTVGYLKNLKTSLKLPYKSERAGVGGRKKKLKDGPQKIA